MIESHAQDIWVFMETTAKGTLKNIGLELLTPGHFLAQKLKGEVVAVIVGNELTEASNVAETHGVDRIIVVDDEAFASYSTDGYTHALCTLVEKYHPAAMLIGATNNGRDLGPRVSGRLQTGLVADCTSLDVDEATNDVTWTRPAFGGNLMATIICPDHRPQIGTVRPGVFKPPTPTEPHASIITEHIELPKNCIRTQVLKVINATGPIVDLEGVEVIVSGGRGMGGPEGFALLQTLADILGGAVGASRVAVDSGWIDHSHQVGQTGKSVGPHLYFACGISGAVQHLAGMSGADTVVAINKDASAPIFGAADFGVVGDVMSIIPALIEELKKPASIWRGQSTS